MSGERSGFRKAVPTSTRVRILHRGKHTAGLSRTSNVMRDALSSEREWTQIIRGEFLEIPGLRLTKGQIQQLWELRADACTTVLEALLSQRFLQLTADGHYVLGPFGGTPLRAPQVGIIDREMAVRGH
jgi:hypothetical protein